MGKKSDKKSKKRSEDDKDNSYKLSKKLLPSERRQFEKMGVPDLSQNWLELFTPTVISDLHTIMRSCSDNQQKADYVEEELKDYGFSPLGEGTNILVMTNPVYPGVVFKIALDDCGVADNFNDFVLYDMVPHYAKPLARDSSAIVSVQQRYVVMKDRDRMSYFWSDIIELLHELSEYFLIADLSPEMNLNYGIDRDGSFVIIDGSDLYPLNQIKEPIRCKRIVGEHKYSGEPKYCEGKLHYTDDFSWLVCDRCGREYLPLELRPKKEVDKLKDILSDGYSNDERKRMELEELEAVAARTGMKLELPADESAPAKEIEGSLAEVDDDEEGYRDAPDTEDEDPQDDEDDVEEMPTTLHRRDEPKTMTYAAERIDEAKGILARAGLSEVDPTFYLANEHTITALAGYAVRQVEVDREEADNGIISDLREELDEVKKARDESTARAGELQTKLGTVEATNKSLLESNNQLTADLAEANKKLAIGDNSAKALASAKDEVTKLLDRVTTLEKENASLRTTAPKEEAPREFKVDPDRLAQAEGVLINNGVDYDLVANVLQAVGQVLLSANLYPVSVTPHFKRENLPAASTETDHQNGENIPVLPTVEQLRAMAGTSGFLDWYNDCTGVAIECINKSIVADSEDTEPKIVYMVLNDSDDDESSAPNSSFTPGIYLFAKGDFDTAYVNSGLPVYLSIDGGSSFAQAIRANQIKMLLDPAIEDLKDELAELEQRATRPVQSDDDTDMGEE